MKVTGTPPPDVKWYFEGKLVKASKYISLSSKGKVHKLVIDEAAIEDEGVYKCVAENKSGKVETHTDVFIEG